MIWLRNEQGFASCNDKVDLPEGLLSKRTTPRQGGTLEVARTAPVSSRISHRFPCLFLPHLRYYLHSASFSVCTSPSWS